MNIENKYVCHHGRLSIPHELTLTHLLAHNHSTGCASIAGRNIISSGSSSTAALQEQADNLPRAGSLFSASCFHLCGQHQDWWLSLPTVLGSVPTTLRRCTRTAALQEQADNLPRAGSFFSASCFHLCGQHQDWWLSFATGPGSVPTTLRRLPPKHCHHSQVVVRQNSLPSKLCACCRWHSRAPCLAARHEVENTSSLKDVSKQALDQHVSPLQKRYVC